MGPVATGSALSPSKSAESVAKPPTRKPALPTPAPNRRIRRQGAFYHLSDEEEAPWKAPGGCNPRPDGTHPTQGRFRAERPALRSPPSVHPPVIRSSVSAFYGDGTHLLSRNLLSPFRLPAPQGSQPSHSLPAPPLPQADSAPTFPLREAGAIIPAIPAQPVSTSHTRPFLWECSLLGIPTPFRPLGPSIPPPSLCLQITAPTRPTTPNRSPKRKREDTGDVVAGDEASDKKRPRLPPSDVD